MEQTEVVKDVATLKADVKNHDKRIDNLENSNKEIAKLTTLMEEQIKVQKETNQKQEEKMDRQQKQMDRQHETLVKMNENLTSLTTGLKDVNDRVGKLEETETQKKEFWPKLVKQTLWIAIPGLVLAALVAYFNLK